MSDVDARLGLALDALRDATASYLRWLHDVWVGEAGTNPQAGTDVDRIVAAVGRQCEPTESERQRVTAALGALTEVSEGPLATLVERVPLELGDELLVAAAYWAEADPQFATVVGCAHDDGGRRYATAALVRLVLAPFDVEVVPALDADHRLVRHGIVAPGAGATNAVTLTPTARLVLAGLDPTGAGAPETRALPPRLAPRLAPRLQPAAAALARRLTERTAGERSITILRGARGSGRRALAHAASAGAGLTPVTVDRPAAELRLLGRLGHQLLMIEEAELDESPGADVLAEWTEGDGPVVLTASPTYRPAADLAGDALVVDVPVPSTIERRRHWVTVLGRVAGLDQHETGASIRRLADQLAGRFRFTEGAIDAAAAQARRQAAWSGGRVNAEALWEACRRQPEHDLERLAALITPTFHLDDLVVSTDTRAQLDELLAHVVHQTLVLDTWGFRHRLPRGQGVAALFAGPPGTGKTMAAEALAHALHHDLYRVDLSSVVSKWLGETEKNLASAFDEAERSGAVLFFDEADALFATRTEVRDAHDRYANLEVNYLLQRVEAFTGLVILASNRRSALDEAFLRRLRFVIHFEMPGRDARRELWSRSFPPAADRVELDWDALAAGELAGASIQNVALSAAFLAAGDGGRITIDHLALALGREYDKLGKSFPGLPTATGAST